MSLHTGLRNGGLTFVAVAGGLLPWTLGMGHLHLPLAGAAAVREGSISTQCMLGWLMAYDKETDPPQTVLYASCEQLPC